MVPAVMEPFVESDWVCSNPDAVLADVRWYLDGRSGRAAYDGGHLPGAVFVDMDAVLAAPASPAEGRHPLPRPERFAAGMAELGLGGRGTGVAHRDPRGGGGPRPGGVAGAPG